LVLAKGEGKGKKREKEKKKYKKIKREIPKSIFTSLDLGLAFLILYH